MVHPCKFDCSIICPQFQSCNPGQDGEFTVFDCVHLFLMLLPLHEMTYGIQPFTTSLFYFQSNQGYNPSYPFTRPLIGVITYLQLVGGPRCDSLFLKLVPLEKANYICSGHTTLMRVTVENNPFGSLRQMISCENGHAMISSAPRGLGWLMFGAGGMG